MSRTLASMSSSSVRLTRASMSSPSRAEMLPESVSLDRPDSRSIASSARCLTAGDGSCTAHCSRTGRTRLSFRRPRASTASSRISGCDIESAWAMCDVAR